MISKYTCGNCPSMVMGHRNDATGQYHVLYCSLCGWWIAIFWRESPESWKGHVGIYINEDDGNIFLLGGNQGPNRSVMIQRYSMDRLLGYRRLLSE